MGNYSAAMLKEVKRSNPDLIMGVKFEFPDGTIKRYGEVPFCSLDDGYHEPSIKEIGEIEDAGPDRKASLEISEWRGLQIIDVRREWTQRLRNYSLKGTPVTLTFYSKRVTSPARLVRFYGVILSVRPVPQDGLVEITCGPWAILPLLSKVPRLIMTEEYFPNIPKEMAGLYAPGGCYGIFDNYGSATNTGSYNVPIGNGPIRPIYVGEYEEVNLKGQTIEGSRYIISPNQVYGVLNVLRNGTALIETDWSDQAIFQETGGITWSRIQLKADRSADEITVCCIGHEDEGDGTGQPILKPAAIIRHWLANTVWNQMLDARNLGWYTDADAALSVAYLDLFEAWLERRTPAGYRNNLYIEAAQEQVEAIDKVNEFLQSNEAWGFFTMDGNLAPFFDNFDYVDPATVMALHRSRHELSTGTFRWEQPSANVVRRISAEAGYSSADTVFTQKLRCNSEENDLAVADSVQATMLPHYR